MSHLCLVPAKRLALAKARLTPALGADDRRELTLAMLADVVATAAACGPVWVICSDPEAERVARGGGAQVLRDAVPDAGLNASLDAATNRAIEAGYAGALVLASDLPCATPEDVRAVLEAGSVALAPSRSGGTNALWRSPPGVIATAFGAGSRAAHETLASAAGIPAAIVDRPGLALDVDRPEDLDAALDLGPGPATRTLLEGLARRRGA